jgi:hypothetical protein
MVTPCPSRLRVPTTCHFRAVFGNFLSSNLAA